MNLVKRIVCEEHVSVIMSERETLDVRKALDEWHMSVSSVLIHAHPAILELRDRLHQLTRLIQEE